MNFKKKLIVLLVSPLLISCNSFLTLFKKVNDTTETNVETSKPTETLNEKIEQTQDETIDFFNLATTRFSVSDAYALGIGENNSLKTRAPEDPRPLEFLKQKVQSFTGIVPELDISSVAITETKNSDTLNAYNFSCIAKRKKDDLNVIEDLIFTENTIEVKVDSMHSFRIVNNEFSEDSGWIKGSGDYISYQVSNEGKEHINQYKVYVRSDDAFIKFDDADGLTYTIKDSNGNILFEDLKDNDEADADPSEGMIIVEGLTEDETYQIQKSGYIEIEEISTENLDFGIEHVYVYNTQYSFVTFVGMGQSCRGGGEEGVFTDVTGADERDCGFYNYKGQTLTYVLENTTGRLLPIKYEGKVRIRNRIIQDASSLMVLDLCIFDD